MIIILSTPFQSFIPIIDDNYCSNVSCVLRWKYTKGFCIVLYYTSKAPVLRTVPFGWHRHSARLSGIGNIIADKST